MVKYNKIDYKQLNINIVFLKKEEFVINSQLCDSFFIFKITITNDSVQSIRKFLFLSTKLYFS